jgi:hypothetical protein
MRRIILFLIAVLTPLGASAQAIQYTAKFACGKASELANYAPGAFFTTINVLNPSKETRFEKRFLLANVDEKPGAGTKWVPSGLPAEAAYQIDCRNILAHLSSAGIPLPPGQVADGFVVLRSPVELDVIGVYSAAGPGGLVSTLHMERIPPRRVQ